MAAPSFVDAEIPYKDGPMKARIWNGRLEKPHTLEEHGFELAPMTLPKGGGGEEALNWFDPNVVASVLYPLAETMLHSVFPTAKKVVVFDHIARSAARMSMAKAESLHKSEEMGEDEKENKELNGENGKAAPQQDALLGGPVRRVHGDYTARSGWNRTRELLSVCESSERVSQAMNGRFVLVNVWVPLNKAERDPMGMVEWATSAPRDVLRVKTYFPHRTGEGYDGVRSELHRWVYYPNMEPGEVLILKTYDSEEDGRARFVIHTAFVDPTSPPNAPERESIELRCIVFCGSDVPDGFAATFVPPHLDPSSPDHDLTPPRTEVSGPMDEW